MKTLITLFSAVLTVLSMQAAPVDVNQARSAARSFLKSNSPKTKTFTPELHLVWSDAAGSMTKSSSQEVTYYVFNRTDGEGFVAVAGDDAAYPILGYSLDTTFRTDSMPVNLRDWFEGYRSQIQWLRDQGYTPTQEVKSAWNALLQGDMRLTAHGTQLHTVLWDQITPYNALCPTIEGQKVPAGCVATSIAIAMQYHKWPDVGQGSHTYTSKTHELTLSATFNTPYAWDNMPDTYTTGSYTPQQAQNVATLMYDCGVFSEMDYAPSGSGAFTLTAARGLVNYMNYDKSLQVLRRNGYPTKEWESMIKAEIDQDRPVIYGGVTSRKEGHLFILEGYNGEGYYAVNWGWSGIANGYYLLSALDPQMQGAGGSVSGEGFDFNQDAIFNMKPAVEGSSYKDVLTFFPGEGGGIQFKGISTTTSPIVPNATFRVQAGFMVNSSIRPFDGVAVVALVDAEGNIKEMISTETPISLEINDGTAGDIPCFITTGTSSDDRIRLLYKSSDSDEWQWVRGGGSTTGEIRISDPAPVQAPESQPNLSIIYEPQGDLNLTSEAPLRELLLFDINGRLLKRQQTGDSFTASFSCHEYPTGIYILRVRTTEGYSNHKVLRN